MQRAVSGILLPIAARLRVEICRLADGNYFPTIMAVNMRFLKNRCPTWVAKYLKIRLYFDLKAIPPSPVPVLASPFLKRPMPSNK
jgi:hypothetical protein